jgi:ESS family glutamate:Na+ symporter
MADSFSGVLAFAFMASMILVGTVLRARVPWFQFALIPASLLGGLIGFLLISSGYAFGYTSQDFVPFAFHFFTLSFMSLVLTGKEPSADNTSIQPGGIWLAIGWTMSLVLQALVGLSVLVTYNLVTGGELSHYLGILVTHGFTQGPGQAMAMGSIWESEFGVSSAVNFGLIYASMGFVISFVIGVPAARYAIRNGLNSANVDSLVFHLSILGVAYLMTNEYLVLMQSLLDGATFLGVPMVLLFSHNLFFIHGLVVCLILRAVINRLGYGHCIDNETQKRITGSSVDLMMVGTVMSIQFALLANYLVPILAVCLAAAVTTALMCFLFGRMLNTLPVERAITLFGCCTGSTGSGLLLLRILDPDLSTPVARELAYFNVAIIFVSLHILMFMAPILPSIGLGIVCAVYGATFAAGGGLLWFLSPRT